MQSNVNPVSGTFQTDGSMGRDHYPRLCGSTPATSALATGRTSSPSRQSITHENQNLEGTATTFNLANGTAFGPKSSLNQIRLNASYWYQNTYGLTLGWQNTWGPPEPGALSRRRRRSTCSNSANGKPNSNAFIIEADWVPFGKDGFVEVAVGQPEARHPVHALYAVQRRQEELRRLRSQCRRQQHAVPVRLDGVLRAGGRGSRRRIQPRRPRPQPDHRRQQIERRRRHAGQSAPCPAAPCRAHRSPSVARPRGPAEPIGRCASRMLPATTCSMSISSGWPMASRHRLASASMRREHSISAGSSCVARTARLRQHAHRPGAQIEGELLPDQVRMLRAIVTGRSAARNAAGERFDARRDAAVRLAEAPCRRRRRRATAPRPAPAPSTPARRCRRSTRSGPTARHSASPGSRRGRRRPSIRPPCAWKYHHGRPLVTNATIVSGPSSGPMRGRNRGQRRGLDRHDHRVLRPEIRRVVARRTAPLIAARLHLHGQPVGADRRQMRAPRHHRYLGAALRQQSGEPAADRPGAKHANPHASISSAARDRACTPKPDAAFVRLIGRVVQPVAASRLRRSDAQLECRHQRRPSARNPRPPRLGSPSTITLAELLAHRVTVGSSTRSSLTQRGHPAAVDPPRSAPACPPACRRHRRRIACSARSRTSGVQRAHRAFDQAPVRDDVVRRPALDRAHRHHRRHGRRHLA